MALVTQFDQEYSFEPLYTDEDLQCIYFDEEAGEWTPITTEVNVDAKQIICRADHFRLFALVADTDGQFDSTSETPNTLETPNMSETPDRPDDLTATVFLPFTTR